MNISSKNINRQIQLFRVFKTFDTLRKSGSHCNKSELHTSQFYTTENKLGHLYQFWKEKFINLDISEPKESIENILAHVIGSKRVSDVYKNFYLNLNNQQVLEIEKMCNQRLKKMPVQYVIGEWDFRDLTLKMRPPVFIPRPETELLIEIIINDLKSREEVTKILEICCGSGAISLALLKSCPGIKVTAIDQSIQACQLTAENAGTHQLKDRLTVKHSTLTDDNRLREVTGTFNIIVSNPPYVPTPQLAHLQPEIALFEDLKALDGGEDGLSLIKCILHVASEKLLLGGLLYIEVDVSHPDIIADYVRKHRELKLDYVTSYKDFCDKNRFVKIIKI